MSDDSGDDGPSAEVVTITGKPIDPEQLMAKDGPLLSTRGFQGYCDHTWEIDQKERTIICTKCHQESTAFDVLVSLSGKEGRLHQSIMHLQQKIAELKAWSPRLKATRRLEKIWRGSMLPCCPCCGVGIDHTEMQNPSCVSKDIAHIEKERKRRR